MLTSEFDAVHKCNATETFKLKNVIRLNLTMGNPNIGACCSE